MVLRARSFTALEVQETVVFIVRCLQEDLIRVKVENHIEMDVPIAVLHEDVVTSIMVEADSKIHTAVDIIR